MRRRHVLHLLAGAAAAGAGCALVETSPESEQLTPTGTAHGADGDRTATTAVTDDDPYALGETASVDGVGEVTVESVAVQRSVIDAHAWREVYEPTGAQVLVVEAAAVGDDRPEFSFTARLDGERVDSAVRVPLSSDGTRHALSVPVRPVEEATVELESSGRPAWSLPGPARERLASAPEFHLHDATVREDDGGGTVLDLVVENRGDRVGTFRAIVVSKHAADADDAVRFPVPEGQSVTGTVRNSIVRNWDPEDEFEHDVSPDTRRFAVGYG